MKKLIIIGAGGHGKVIADIASKNGYEEIAFLDDNPEIIKCGKYLVLGKIADLANINGDVIVAIGNIQVHKRIQEMIPENRIVSLVHPKAIVADNVLIGAGSVVMAGTVINVGACIGKGCIINTCSSVDHDCVIRDYCHISVGAPVAGTSCIGEQSWIGAGATVSNNINICSSCMIGAGAVVIRDIKERGTYVGVPAKKIK